MKLNLEGEFYREIRHKIQIPFPKGKSIIKIDSKSTKIWSKIFTQNDVKWIEISFSPLPFKEKKFIFEFYLK